MKITSVSSPVYSREDQSTVDCIVTFDTAIPGFSLEDTHHYTAAAHDPEPHGQELWEGLQAGSYLNWEGSIASYVAPVLTPYQIAQNAIALGINITSTGTPALNGNYSLDQNSQNKLNGIITYILLNNSFPAGQSVMPWYDSQDAVHIFPSIEAFKNFATAFTNYLATVIIFSDSSGEIGAIPSNDVTIP